MLSSLTPEEAMTKLAERIASRVGQLRHKEIIAAELGSLRRIVGAAQRYNDNPNRNNGKKVREALTGFLRGKDDKQA